MPQKEMVETMFQFNKNFMKNILKKIIPLFFLIILGCNNPSINIDSSNIKDPNKIEKLITTPKEINTKALQHFLDGEMYLSQGDYSMAVIEFQDALRYDALSSAIYLSLAEVLLRLNKFERAEEILIQALELNDSIQEIREFRIATRKTNPIHNDVPENTTFLLFDQPSGEANTRGTLITKTEEVAINAKTANWKAIGIFMILQTTFK